jgi:hypothetical protein
MTRLAIALAFLGLLTTAQARVHVYARVKCAGLYCAIVTEPDQPPSTRAATWRKGWLPR